MFIILNKNPLYVNFIKHSVKTKPNPIGTNLLLFDAGKREQITSH